MTDENLTLSVKDIAEKLGVTGNTVRAYIERGELPATPLPYGRKGVTYKIKKTDFEEFLKKCQNL